MWFRKAKAEPVTIDRLSGGISYYDSERHWLQVDHFSYRALLRRLVRRFGVEPPPAGGAVLPRPVEREHAA